MWFPWHRLDPNERIASRILVRKLGPWRALMVGRRIRRAARRDEPFGALPPAVDERERLSRAQIGPAILLYRELLRIREPDAARALTEEVVVAGAVAFLREQIGSLRRADLEGMDPEAQKEFARSRGERFFNATVTWDTVGSDEVRFTVTACRFPPLCAAAGVPELAPVFCAGDAHFFGTVEPDVLLERPQMIAEGAETCRFRLYWASSTPGSP